MSQEVTLKRFDACLDITKAAHCIHYIGEGTIIKDIKFETLYVHECVHMCVCMYGPHQQNYTMLKCPHTK